MRGRWLARWPWQRKGLRFTSVLPCGFLSACWPLWQWCLPESSPLALRASCGSCLWSGLSAPPSHSNAAWLPGPSNCGGIRRPLWGSVCLAFYPTPGQVWHFALATRAPLLAHQISAQLHPEHVPSQGHLGTSRPYPRHTKPSNYSGKPNSCSPSSNSAALPGVLWCGPFRPGQHSLWDELPVDCQIGSKPSMCSPSIPCGPLLPTWGIHSLFCFSLPSSFQSSRPEEGCLFHSSHPCAPDPGSVPWARRSGHSLPCVFLPLYSALWLRLKNKWEGRKEQGLTS